MPSNIQNIKKLQTALNLKGVKVLYSTSQFYSNEENRAITMYKLENSIYDDEKGKYKKVKLFETASQIQVLLFLRDMWNEINGLPEDLSNEYWNEVKKNKLGVEVDRDE